MTDEHAHGDVVGMGSACDEIARLQQALAEKDREIERLRREVALLKADDAERCALIRDMEEEERKNDAEIERLQKQLANGGAA